jgi:hypothetical protein
LRKLFFFVPFNHFVDFLLILLALRVVDGENSHEDISWVVKPANLVAHTLEVIGAFRSLALENDMAITHQDDSVEESKGLGRWLVDRSTNSLALIPS